jgi:hypothetical protein
VSGGKTHTKQLVTGCIRGLFSSTFEVATYTILLMTVGSSKHGGIRSVIYFGTEGRQYVPLEKRQKDGGCNY